MEGLLSAAVEKTLLLVGCAGLAYRFEERLHLGVLRPVQPDQNSFGLFEVAPAYQDLRRPPLLPKLLVAIQLLTHLHESLLLRQSGQRTLQGLFGLRIV